MNTDVLSRWDSPAEKLIFSLLKKYINTDYYSISTHVNLDRVFPALHRIHSFEKEYYDFCAIMNRLHMQESVHFDKMHFDFVIYENRNDYPILIIEVNGKQHISSSTKKHIDQFKNFISYKYDIPLRTLELYNSYPNEVVDTLLCILLNNASIAGNYSVYCKCGTKLEYKSAAHEINGHKEIKYYYRCCNCKKSNGKPLTYNLSEIPSFFNIPFTIK